MRRLICTPPHNTGHELPAVADWITGHFPFIESAEPFNSVLERRADRLSIPTKLTSNRSPLAHVGTGPPFLLGHPRPGRNRYDDRAWPSVLRLPSRRAAATCCIRPPGRRHAGLWAARTRVTAPTCGTPAGGVDVCRCGRRCRGLRGRRCRGRCRLGRRLAAHVHGDCGSSERDVLHEGSAIQIVERLSLLGERFVEDPHDAVIRAGRRRPHVVNVDHGSVREGSREAANSPDSSLLSVLCVWFRCGHSVPGVRQPGVESSQ